MKPALPVALIARMANRVAAGHGWPPLSYSTVRSITAGLDAGMRTLAQRGTAAYRDNYELAWRHRAERPNAIWQADHTELDILVLDANLKPARPWLTTMLDDYSRAICGYTVFLGAPSATNTALALRQVIWPKAGTGWPMCGIPDVLYVDHGSDFTSNHLTQTAKDLHFEITYSTVARPQGRGKIERFFGTVNTVLLAELPSHLSRGTPPAPGITLKELDETIGRFIMADYHQREHPEIKATPHNAWTGDGWLPRLPASMDELNLLLLTVAKPRIVHRDGVHFQGLRYVSPLLAAYVREPVTVRYDPRDITEIRVFHKNQFICRAVNPDHETSTITLKDIQAARSARRRELHGQINQRIAVVAKHLPDLAPAKQAPAPEPTDQPKKRPKLRTYLEDDR
ncbi:Mu transposase C-terminal domain-containing protein [Arthrobacter sp. ISL-30]|uniref:Mu transposase C-terminal domain-containing protein n=1 Tax=Arthrobacter sp. ISL-30 TaxID=2819109 RepID=UPI0027DEC711|nr:Mu transposase C-terminal domain-containing protein [Arthrobacter sp. ISL-30]